MNLLVHPTNKPARLINVLKVVCIACGGKLKVTDAQKGMVESCAKTDCRNSDKQGVQIEFHNGMKMIREFTVLPDTGQS